MRKITFGPIIISLALLSLALTAGIFTSNFIFAITPASEFRSIIAFILAVILSYCYAIMLHRMSLVLLPIKDGSIEEGSKEEFNYHVYLLTYLLAFQPLTRSLFLPVPVMRVIYLALGAKLGFNSYSAGTILDPPLTSIGDNCIIGHDALLFSHAVEGKDLSLSRIQIGNNVTIGAKAVIMPGVTIEDGAIVAVAAVVPKGTKIGAGEIWGGIPAKLIKLKS